MSRLIRRFTGIDTPFNEAQLITLQAHRILTNQQQLVNRRQRHHQYRPGALAYQALKTDLIAISKTQIHTFDIKKTATRHYGGLEDLG